jgi:hypothetical protein
LPLHQRRLDVGLKPPSGSSESTCLRGLQSRVLVGVLSLLMLVMMSGCARQSPSRNALSGRRLLVTLRFRGEINPNYSYFFLINNAGNQNAPGPVPVLIPPYGNGFATGSGGGQNGFTDFVRFDNFQVQGYGVYHVVGDPNANQFVRTGRPVSAVIPDLSPGSLTSKELRFELDFSQLITDANGNPLPDPVEAANLARAIRFLQINVVATSIVPADPTTPVTKLTDAFGDTRTLLGASSFFILDSSQTGRVFRSSDFVGQPIEEPTSSDVFDGDEPSLDLIEWTIEVRDFS